MTWAAFALDFLVPSVLGSTAGGVLLVAILNFAQTEEGTGACALPDHRMLSWKECLLEKEG